MKPSRARRRARRVDDAMAVSAFRLPPALQAAELDLYRDHYGASVREMDRTVAATASSRSIIDLTHGDTRAFLPPESAERDFVAALAENTEAYTAYRGSANVRTTLAPRLTELLVARSTPTASWCSLRERRAASSPHSQRSSRPAMWWPFLRSSISWTSASARTSARPVIACPCTRMRTASSPFATMTSTRRRVVASMDSYSHIRTTRRAASTPESQPSDLPRGSLRTTCGPSSTSSTAVWSSMTTTMFTLVHYPTCLSGP